jgi:hypothetical protein
LDRDISRAVGSQIPFAWNAVKPIYPTANEETPPLM